MRRLRSPWWRRLRLPVLGLAVLAVWLALPAISVAEVHTGRAGVALIEHFEGDPNGGCPYYDVYGAVWTRGYGETDGIGPLSPCLTPRQADRDLRVRLATNGYEAAVRTLFARGGALAGKFTQHAFDGFASVVWNLGTGAVRCSAGFGSLCAALRTHSLHAAARALLSYDHAGGQRLLGLTLRRRAEAALIVRPMGRFELFAPIEIHLILAFDREHPSPARAARLQAAMRARAAALARTARRDRDWLSQRRLDRFDALERRLHHPR